MMLSASLLFSLLVLYQAKHFLADFPLQGAYMLGKFKPGWDFLMPLLAHVGVHAGMTLAIVLFWVQRPELWWLALVDAGIHFTMDRIKAGPKYLGRFKSLCYHDFEHRANMTQERWDGKVRSNQMFWWSLGVDQMVHHLTHYFLIWMMLT